METMSKTLQDFDRKVKKERARDKYNDRMKKRLQKVNGSGKAQKVHSKKPQSRTASTKVNKGEEFTKSKPWTKRIALALGRKYKGKRK